MSDHIGEHLPDINVYEYISKASGTCPAGPKAWRLPDIAHKKKIVAIGVIGAFTPVCSSNHIPDYLKHYKDFRKKGVDELWCIAVNDAFVMSAWGKQLKAGHKMRMLSDGSRELVTAMDETLDLTSWGMGVRSDRFAMVVDNGLITDFLREDPGHYCTTDAQTLLSRL